MRLPIDDERDRQPDPAPDETAADSAEQRILAERRRLADDLHDIAGFTFTTAIVQIEAIRRLLKENPQESVRRMERLQEFMRLGLDDIRRSVRTMKGAPGQEGGIDLEEALGQLLETTRDMTGATVESEVSVPLNRLAPAQKKVLYHAVREGLTNGIRHGRCTRFFVSIAIRDDLLELLMDNDGSPAAGSDSGIGLCAMRSRVGALGGTMGVSASPEGGYRLRVRLPVGDPIFPH